MSSEDHFRASENNLSTGISLSVKDDIIPQQDKMELLRAQVKGIINDDRQACNDFVADHYQWLTIIVRQQFPYTDLYLDIVHDAFALTFEKLKAGEIEKIESLKFYLRTAALNIGFAYHRKDQKFRSNLDQELLFMIKDAGDSAFQKVSWDESISYVKSIIDRMPVKRDQDILTKFYFEDLDKLTICSELDITPDHFSRVLFRAKHRLKEMVSSQKKKDNIVSMFKTPVWLIGLLGFFGW